MNLTEADKYTYTNIDIPMCICLHFSCIIENIGYIILAMLGWGIIERV